MVHHRHDVTISASCNSKNSANDRDRSLRPLPVPNGLRPLSSRTLELPFRPDVPATFCFYCSVTASSSLPSFSCSPCCGILVTFDIARLLSRWSLVCFLHFSSCLWNPFCRLKRIGASNFLTRISECNSRQKSKRKCNTSEECVVLLHSKGKRIE